MQSVSKIKAFPSITRMDSRWVDPARRYTAGPPAPPAARRDRPCAGDTGTGARRDRPPPTTRPAASRPTCAPACTPVPAGRGAQSAGRCLRPGRGWASRAAARRAAGAAGARAGAWSARGEGERDVWEDGPAGWPYRSAAAAAAAAVAAAAVLQLQEIPPRVSKYWRIKRERTKDLREMTNDDALAE